MSRDVENPKWKPMHMAASWNRRNRRIAKQRAKTNWYKGVTEVEIPTPASSRQEETKKPDAQEEEGRDRERVSRGMEEENIGGEPKPEDKICNGGEAAKGMDDEQV